MNLKIFETNMLLCISFFHIGLVAVNDSLSQIYYDCMRENVYHEYRHFLATRNKIGGMQRYGKLSML